MQLSAVFPFGFKWILNPLKTVFMRCLHSRHQLDISINKKKKLQHFASDEQEHDSRDNKVPPLQYTNAHLHLRSSSLVSDLFRCNITDKSRQKKHLLGNMFGLSVLCISSTLSLSVITFRITPVNSTTVCGDFCHGATVLSCV